MVPRLFRQTDQALAIVGVGPMATPVSSRRPPADSSVEITERLLGYEQELLDQLQLLSQQAQEFDDDVLLGRIEAEGLALLIALRELWRFFPQVPFALPVRAPAP
jgi:hypothetical protein